MFQDATNTPLDELPLICFHPSADPAAWPFDSSATAVELFEVLPKELSGHGVGVEFAGDHLGKKR